MKKLSLLIVMLSMLAHSAHAMDDGSESSSDGCTSEELKFLPHKVEDEWFTVVEEPPTNIIIPAAAVFASSATLVAGSCLRNPYLVSAGVAGLSGAARMSLRERKKRPLIDETKIEFNNPIKQRKFFKQESDNIIAASQSPQAAQQYTNELRERMKIKQQRRVKEKAKEQRRKRK